MVHALGEIHRVLAPDGVLIDLRPLCDRWSVEVVSARETRVTGYVTDLPLGLEDDAAANRAMAQAEANGWFTREKETFFPLNYLWDTASDMEKWIDEEWENFIGLDEETRRATRSAWALGDADSRVRVRVKMLITRWKKQQG
jgi:SAM-dependent methyltransferase